MQHGRKHFSTLCGSVPPSLFYPLLNSYFSHLFQPFSVTQGLNLVSTWVKVPHLGTFIWFQYLNFPPLRLSSKLTTFPAFIKFQYLYFPLAFLKLLAFILFQYLNFPRCPSTTSCIHVVSYVAPPRPPRNFLQASFFDILRLSHTCASQQLPAFMRFQDLGFSPRLSTTSCMHRHLGSISLRSYGLNIYTSPRP